MAAWLCWHVNGELTKYAAVKVNLYTLFLIYFIIQWENNPDHSGVYSSNSSKETFHLKDIRTKLEKLRP
jgi:hypothetical protein